MADWYYFQGGNQQGPVSDDQLRGMVASGQLSPGDSVWKQGMANWSPIASIPELAPAGGGAPRPGPGPAGPPAVGPVQNYQDDYGYDNQPGGPSGGVTMISIWSIIMVSGAGLWFINLFLPWWTFSFPGGPVLSITVMGFRYGVAWFAFIIALLILGFIITSFFVRVLAAWRWTGSFFFALMGLILLILGIVAFANYGFGIGPLVHLLATLAVLAGAVLEGVFGLLAFLARAKANRSAAGTGQGNYQ